MITSRSRAERLFRDTLRHEVRSDYTKTDVAIWKLTMRRYPRHKWFYPSDTDERPNPHILRAKLFLIGRHTEGVSISRSRIEKIAMAEVRRHRRRGEGHQAELISRAFELD